VAFSSSASNLVAGDTNRFQDGFVAAAFAQCPGGSLADTDGDGLLDCWERDGIDFDGDSNINLVLYDVNQDGVIDANERADPNHRDNLY
jgi:hypothetical protein